MRRFWWLVLGGLMLVAGFIVAGASHSRGQSSFGWIAYSPLSEPEPSLDDQLARDARDTWAGIALAAVGLVVIAGGACYRIGQRRGPAPPTT